MPNSNAIFSLFSPYCFFPHWEISFFDQFEWQLTKHKIRMTRNHCFCMYSCTLAVCIEVSPRIIHSESTRKYQFVTEKWGREKRNINKFAHQNDGGAHLSQLALSKNCFRMPFVIKFPAWHTHKFRPFSRCPNDFRRVYEFPSTATLAHKINIFHASLDPIEISF